MNDKIKVHLGSMNARVKHSFDIDLMLINISCQSWNMALKSSILNHCNSQSTAIMIHSHAILAKHKSFLTANVI